MSLLLKEISVSEEDKALLNVFSQAREKVLSVAVSPLLPDVVGVTTQRGFVELINVKSGDFRLFLTHLDHIPLETDLRCFAFAPCLLAALSEARRASDLAQVATGAPPPSSANSLPPPHCLVYSVAFSNQLLVAEVDSGCVSVLVECDSRPSAVMADGDYIVCGEGSGRLTTWRLRDPDSVSASARSTHGHLGDEKDSSTAAGCVGRTPEKTRRAILPPLAAVLEKLWSSTAIHEDTVTSLVRRRHQLFCCGADLTCRIVHIDTGVEIGKLVQEPHPLQSLCPLLAGAVTTASSLSPRDGRGTMIAAYGYQVVLYREVPPQYDATGAEVEVEILPPSASPAALKVYDGHPYGVSAPHAWVSAPPMQHPSVYAFEGECRTDVPLTCLTCSHRYIAAGSLSGVVILYYCNPTFGSVEELVRFDVGFSVVAIQLFSGDVEDNPQSSSAEVPPADYGGDALLVVTASGDVWRWPMRDLLQPLEEQVSRPTGSSSSSASAQGGDAIAVDSNHNNTNANSDSDPSKNPNKDQDEEDARSGSEPMPQAPAPAPHRYDVNDARGGESSGDRAGLSASPSLCGDGNDVDVVEVVVEESGPDQDNRCQDVESLRRFLGSPPSQIPGLRYGRRMDPRVVDAVLDNAAAHQVAVEKEETVFAAGPDGKRVLWAERDGPSGEDDHMECDNVLPPLPLAASTLHGTAVRLRCAEELLEQPIDVEAVRAAHPLLADSLLFQFPVKTRVHGLSESVYGAVPAIAARAAQESMETKSGLTSAALKAAGGEPSAAVLLQSAQEDGCPCEPTGANLEEEEEEMVRGATGGSTAGNRTTVNTAGGPVVDTRKPTLTTADTDSLRDVTYDTFRRRKDPRREEELQRPGPHIQHHFVHDLLFGFDLAGAGKRGGDEDAFLLFKEVHAQPRAPRGLLFPLPLPSTLPVY